jgi:hypothetical protein
MLAVQLAGRLHQSQASGKRLVFLSGLYAPVGFAVGNLVNCAQLNIRGAFSASKVPGMPKANLQRRRTLQPIVAAVVPPVVAAVVQPVAKRLARIEALLIEMRFEHDIQTKRINALKTQLDALTERRLTTHQKHDSQRTNEPRARRV